MNDRASANGSGMSGMEVELKLHLDPADMPRLLRHPFLKAIREGEARTSRLRTVYWDTPDLDLLHLGMALRIRRDGQDRIMTLKAAAGEPAGTSAVVAVRREWEWPVSGDRPDPERLRGEEVRDLVPATALARLRPIFTTRFRRTALILRTAPPGLIELALDLGEIRAGDARLPISEIELELKAGRVGILYDLALDIQRIVPLRIGTTNKAEAGYELILGRPASPPRAVGPAFTPMTTVAEAFRHTVRSSLAAMLGSSDGIRAGSREDMGRMQEALARLQSALKLFAQVVPAPDAADIAGEIRWLGRLVRSAWRLDILQARFGASFEPPPRDEGGGEEGNSAPLASSAAQARIEAHRRVAEALVTPRFTALVLRLGGWIEEGRWSLGADEAQSALLDGPLASVGAAWLDRRHRKLGKLGRSMRHGGWHLDPGGLRRLRRHADRLRHAADLLRGIHPPSTLEAYLEAVDSLRRILAEVEALLEARRLPHGAVDSFADWIDRQIRNRLDRLPAAWKDLEKARPVRT